MADATTGQGNDGKERQDTVQELLVAEYKTDSSMKFDTGENLKLWYHDQKSKGNSTSRNWNLMKRYKKHFTKFVQGDF